MLFQSFEFFFIFLPLSLALHWAMPTTGLKNAVLCALSLAFFSWGEGLRLFLLLGIAAWTWAWGPLCARRGNWSLGFALAGPLAALAYYKYSAFLAANLGAVGLQIPAWLTPAAGDRLPLGISFYVFESLSYLIDVRRGACKAETSFSRVLLYLSFFPHLIAGPIVRYWALSPAMGGRTLTLENFASGIERFCWGLAQKVLIADLLGKASADIYLASGAGLGPAQAWMAALLYALQLYFDFPGYSQMAVGLGQMFGFSLPFNFNLPYTATSITDFWRRWHITLSLWFRDYLYIPLGGNRAGGARTAVNLLFVFSACGLWHGASWTFLAWGLFFGFFMALERVLPQMQAPAWLARIYVWLVALLAWTLFNSPDFSVFWSRFQSMAFASQGSGPFPWVLVMPPDSCLALAAGLFLACWPHSAAPQSSLGPLSFAGAVACLVLSLSYIAASSYHPFLYFRF